MEKMKALECYSQYKDPMRIVRGIACFDTLDEALKHAEEKIAEFTRSDLPLAHFYEAVKQDILGLKLLKRFR